MNYILKTTLDGHNSINHVPNGRTIIASYFLFFASIFPLQIFILIYIVWCPTWCVCEYCHIRFFHDASTQKLPKKYIQRFICSYTQPDVKRVNTQYIYIYIHACFVIAPTLLSSMSQCTRLILLSVTIFDSPLLRLGKLAGQVVLSAWTAVGWAVGQRIEQWQIEKGIEGRPGGDTESIENDCAHHPWFLAHYYRSIHHESQPQG